MAEEKEQSAGVFALLVTVKILGVLLSLYLFLFGLDLMGGSFSALGSKGLEICSPSRTILLQARPAGPGGWKMTSLLK